MRWLIYGITVFSLINLLVIAYWRDNQVELTLWSIVFILLVLPLLIIASTYTAVLLFEYIKKKSTSVDEDGKSNDTESADENTPEVIQSLRIYAYALQSSEGDSAADTIEAIQNHKGPELDEELTSLEGKPLLTRRIKLADDELSSLVAGLDDRMLQELLDMPEHIQRVAVIFDRLLKDMLAPLQHLSNGLQQMHLWRTTPSVQQPSLHPAWKGQVIEDKSLDDDNNQTTEALINQINNFPEILHVRYFISEGALAQCDEQLKAFFNGVLADYGFTATSLDVQALPLSPDQQQSKLLVNLLQQIQLDNSGVYLLLGADSTLAQDFIDENIVHSSNYEAAEAGYAVMLTSTQVVIPEFPCVAYLSEPLRLTTKYRGDIKDNMRAILDKIKQNYELEAERVVDEAGLVFVDFNPAYEDDKLEKSALYLGDLFIKSKQIIYSGSVLGQSNLQGSGFALALAASWSDIETQSHNLLCFGSDHDVLVSVVTHDLMVDKSIS